MVLASTLTVQVDSVIDSASSAQEHDLQTALDGLQSLQSFQVNTDLLTETQAGKKVRKLTKHSNEDIAKAAKQLIDTWKDCVRQEQETQALDGESCCNTDKANSVQLFCIQQCLVLLCRSTIIRHQGLAKQEAT